MKCLSWTSPLMPSKNAYSSSCSTFFTSNFFAALEGRNLSNSSITEVSEVNVNFVTTWLNQWKRNNGKKCSKCYSLLYTISGRTIKVKTNSRGSCQIVSFDLKTDYIHLRLVNGVKKLVCQNNSSGTSSPFMVTVCLAKVFTWINIARQRVWEIHSSGTQSLIRRQVVWRNYTEQITEKQNSVKICTRSLKKETPPICGNRCGFDQKKKSCPYKAVMIQLESYKSSNLLLRKFILSKPSTRATSFFQLPTYPTTGEISQQYLPTIRFQCSTFVEIE